MRYRLASSVTAAIMAGMLAAATPASADAPGNDHNCTGLILSAATPQDFHHGAERARAVPQAEDGRGDEITAFTSVTAGEDCSG